VRGDLRPHGARAQNSSFFDLNHGGRMILNEHSFSKLGLRFFFGSVTKRFERCRHTY
jgi:hypothetical protein